MNGATVTSGQNMSNGIFPSNTLIDLIAGLNVSGVPCVPRRHNALQTLAEIETDAVVAGIQRFDLQESGSGDKFRMPGSRSGSAARPLENSTNTEEQRGC